MHEAIKKLVHGDSFSLDSLEIADKRIAYSAEIAKTKSQLNAFIVSFNSMTIKMNADEYIFYVNIYLSDVGILCDGAT